MEYVYLYFFLISFLFSYFLTWLMIKAAKFFRVFDAPGERKIHFTPKPLLGGVGIFISILGIILSHVVFLLSFRFSFLPFQIDKITSAFNKLFWILAGAGIIFTVGLWDDIKKIPFQLKFFFQFLAAVLVLLSGIRIRFLGLPWLTDLITVVWIVGITNSFNLLDNMDGVTAGVSFICLLFFFSFSVECGQYLVPILTVVLAGTTLGFLRFNFSPAQIFMGDAGSLTLGYFLAVISVINVYVSKGGKTFLPLLAPVFILGVPLFDTFSVIFIRIKQKKPICVGDMNHFTHRLARLGLSHRQVAIFIYLVTFLTGCNALILPQINLMRGVVLLIMEVFIFAIIVLLMETKQNQKGKGEK